MYACVTFWLSLDPFQGKRSHALQLFHSMAVDGIPPNYQTYAAVLYALGR